MFTMTQLVNKHIDLKTKRWNTNVLVDDTLPTLYHIENDQLFIGYVKIMTHDECIHHNLNYYELGCYIQLCGLNHFAYTSSLVMLKNYECDICDSIYKKQ